ncbi:MAG: hypothetical protein KDD02_05660 [Phaeodactylibacter sp.]|nr:hypothetical protein [Phaeodactylibacter sp.]MCB9299932.1 hypothetical protein [Lewinellaceae bacterium]
MEFEIYSYRFSKEIIEHPNYRQAYDELIETIQDCPLYFYPNKSSTNPNLDVVQQLTNAYFDRRLSVDFGWEYHPDATNIPDSNLKADFGKSFNELTVHVEVQFGNMARWYSDIFKFQTAYSDNLVDMGVCIVPFNELARRIDSNVANFERCLRELPSADMSITLPILLIGIKPGEETVQINVSLSQFENIQQIIGKGKTNNKFKVVNGILSGTPIEEIGPASPIGPLPF